MKTLLASLFLSLFLISPARATPILYDLTGMQLVGGGTAIGTVIYDPVANMAYDWNLGAIFDSPASFNLHSYLSYTSPTGVVINFALGPLDNNVRVYDITSGVMPLYYSGLGSWLSWTNPAWANDSVAVRLNRIACPSGCPWFMPAPGTAYPSLYLQPGYQQPSHAAVPEPSSMLMMIGGLFLLALFA